jgi:hypothetical protein
LKNTAHRFLPICRQLLRRPTDHRPIFPHHGRFRPPPDPPSRPADLSAKSTDYRLNQVDFRPVVADLVWRSTRRHARLIYWLPQLITGQTRPIFAPSLLIRFGARTEFAPGRFTGYLCRLPADICSVAGDSLSPGLPLAPLSIGLNEE